MSQLLKAHFEKHRVNRMYRVGRCEKCRKPYGYLLTTHALLFLERCKCCQNKRRAARTKYAHSFVWMAGEMMSKKRELSMLLDFDMDLLDLEDEGR